MKRAKFIISIIGVLVALLSGTLARGSQDVVLPLTTLEAHFVSAGIGDTGPISVTAKTDGDKWLSLEIEAYGEKYQLSDKQLAELKGLPLGSLQLTYGDEAMPQGANVQHSIYVKVSKTITTVTAAVVGEDKEVVTRSATMAISKSKGLGETLFGTTLDLSASDY